MTKPVDEIIKSLDTEPEKWTQFQHTLSYKGNKARHIGWIDNIRLRWAINRWNRNQPIMPKEQTQ